jgi:hypothetical protein
LRLDIHDPNCRCQERWHAIAAKSDAHDAYISTIEPELV